MSRIDLDDAEQIQRVIVEPVLAGLRSELSTLIVEGKKHEDRIANLERNQGRALVGMAGVTAGLSLVFGFATDWARRRLGL